MKNLSLLAMSLWLTSVAFAQKNQFDIDAQIRSRAEYRNGQGTLRPAGADPAFFVNERARLALGYNRNDYLELRLAAQHVGVWGDGAQIDKSSNFVLNEAWAKIRPVKSFFIQLGRQTLSYAKERILGGLDWHVSGRYHDALRLGLETGKHSLHGVFAYNQNSENTLGTFYESSETPTASMDYKALQMLWYHYNGGAFQASLLAMNINRQVGTKEAPDTKNMQTWGTYLTWKDGGFALNGSFYLQTGKTTADKSVLAYMWDIKATLKATDVWTFNAGIDNLSGQSDSSDKCTAFNSLYGTHHKFNGAMDYFVFPGYKNNKGLWDFNLGAVAALGKKVSLSGNYHYFMVDEKVKDMNRGLGSEIDLQLDWKIYKDISLTAGYSMMFGTHTMQAVKKGGAIGSWQDWGFLSLNINPRIFSTKW